MPGHNDTAAAGREENAGGGDSIGAIIDAALNRAAIDGWDGLTLTAIADEAGMSLAALSSHVGSVSDILDAFSRRIDRAMLAEADDEPDAFAEQPVKDRLLALIMARLDALEPHRPALRRLADRAERGIPALDLICGQGMRLQRSMGWLAAAAGIEARGLSGLARRQALAAIYLATLRAWLKDDTDDKARTMKTLDGLLDRAGRWSRAAKHFTQRGSRWGRRDKTARAGMAPDGPLADPRDPPAPSGDPAPAATPRLRRPDQRVARIAATVFAENTQPMSVHDGRYARAAIFVQCKNDLDLPASL
ncbi:TetR/AcrR family transcriptional regulator [Tistrella sp. BH-R2-4]|uniref:TetR/AcrR family transcriptional regulator n=2 Tax=Geminicoccaceae TaxID=2066434 RepID=A0ABU9YR50_9PROT